MARPQLHVGLLLLLASSSWIMTSSLAQLSPPGMCLAGGGCRCGAPLVLPTKTAGVDGYGDTGPMPNGAAGQDAYVTYPGTTPVTTPDTTPVTTPITTPVTTPITTPVTAPVPTPVTTPVVRQPVPVDAPAVLNPLPAPQDVTEPVTGFVLPNVAQFDGLGKKLRMIGFGDQKQKAFGVTITVSGTALYYDLTMTPPLWKGMAADALANNQTFYDWLIDLPVDKAIVMYTRIRISKKAFAQAMQKNLGDRLNGQGVDVQASITQLLEEYKGGDKLPARSKIILMWKQPANMLISFVNEGEDGLANQSPDDAPMVGQQKLLRAMFASYLDGTAISAPLKRNVADTFAAM